jgi:hypothetical protein
VTTPSAVVKNTFRVTSADGGVLSQERLRDLRKAVVTCASKSYSTLKDVAASSSKVRALLCGALCAAAGLVAFVGTDGVEILCSCIACFVDDGCECGGDVL